MNILERRERAWVVALGCTLLVLACGDEKNGLGEPCAAGTECVSGLCGTLDGASICTQACAVGDECPTTLDGSAQTCRETSQCGAGCSFSDLRSGYLCNPSTGEIFTCAEGNDVDNCALCGCNVYGGGICIAGRGCLDPVANGGTCDLDALCTSGLCNPSSDLCTAPLAAGEICTEGRYCASNLCNSVCVEPLADGEPCDQDRYCQSGMCDSVLGCISPGAMGDPCRRDSHCTTGNCSNDGDLSTTGHCNKPLLSDCSGASDPQCNRCVGVSVFDRICSRSTCNSSATCGENWDCLTTTAGGRACFEACDPEGFFQCRQSGGVCRSDGVCT